MAWKFELLLKPGTEELITEGPVWDGEYIYITQIRRNRILRYDLHRRLESVALRVLADRACAGDAPGARKPPDQLPFRRPGHDHDTRDQHERTLLQGADRSRRLGDVSLTGRRQRSGFRRNSTGLIRSSARMTHDVS